MLKSRNWMTLLSGALFILAALFMFFNPVLNLATMGMFFAVVVLVDGIVALVHYFQSPSGARTGWDLALAILTILVGISLIGDSALAQAGFIPFLVGFWAIVIGIGRIIQGFKAPSDLKATLLITGTIILVAGIAVICNPVLSGIALVWLLGTALLVFGIIRVVEFFKTPTA